VTDSVGGSKAYAYDLAFKLTSVSQSLGGCSSAAVRRSGW
jgi:hypothetical protein